MGRFVAASLAALVVLVGCGGSPERASADKQLTIPAYGPFPAMTTPVSRGTDAECRAEAEAFGRDAEAFLRPFPSDADNYRVMARVQFTAFRAHLCDISLLRAALSRRLTQHQLDVVLSFFGFMGEMGRALADGPRR